MNEHPFSTRMRLVQEERNREMSRGLERAQQAMKLREKRHKEILNFTKEFLEKSRKGFLGRLLYEILWKTAEKMND